MLGCLNRFPVCAAVAVQDVRERGARRGSRRGRVRLRGPLGAGLAAMLTAAVPAGPEREQVLRGEVSFTRDGNQIVIRASDGAIINYYRFAIGSDELVRFIQPSALARVLNRITGPDPTLIAGTLLANGRVYIVNPAGVYFARGAVVNVGGLYAAAGSITDEHFIRSIDRFTGLRGEVVNRGAIRAGEVALIGERTANHGDIRADRGLVAMLAGDDILIRRHGERITVRIDGRTITDRERPLGGGTAPDPGAAAGVLNTGTITADRGSVVLGAGDLYALAIRNSGEVRAQAGSILAGAVDGLVQNQGVLSASTGAGAAGSVIVQGPSVVNEGEISADADLGRAGTIEVTSRHHTYLLDGSRVSAAGGSAGRADGGRVLIHSYGGLTAMTGGAVLDVSGGTRGGHGGFAEISGETLLFNGEVRLDAIRSFRRATLLLDPRDIRIEDVGTHDDFVFDGVILFPEPDNFTDITLSDEALEALSGHIILQATRNLAVNHPLEFVHNNDLSLIASGHLTVNAAINGVRHLWLEADHNRFAGGDLMINVPLLDIRGDATFYGAHTFLNNPAAGAAITTLGSQTYLGPVDLCVDTTLTASHLHFMSTVDDTVAGVQSLTLHGPAVFEGAVGGLRRLEFLVVHGPSWINGALVVTQDHQVYDGPVRLGGDAIVTSTNAGLIRFARALEGAFDLRVNTAGATVFDGAASLASLTTDAPGSSHINGGSIETTGDQTYNDRVILGDDAMLAADTARFNSTVDAAVSGAAGLSIEGDAVFNGEVGGNSAIASLQTDGGAAINGGLVRTGGNQHYNGPVTLGSDARVHSTGGGDIVFTAALDGAARLDAATAGATRFQGTVGGAVPLRSLATDAPGTTRLGDDMVAGEIDFHDPVRLDASVSITGGSAARFHSTINGNSHNLTVNSPETHFGGDARNLDRLTTDAAGTTTIAANIKGERIDFNDAVELVGDSTITGHAFVDFDRTVNGEHHLVVNSDELVRFGGDVGGAQSLASLETNTRGLVIIDGHLIRAAGDIRFNPQGRSDVPAAATIAARGGDVLIWSAAGDYLMGPNEKLTALGDLEIRARKGRATLGDLNALGDMTVESDDIRLRRRGAAGVLDAGGMILADRGLDFVAGGVFRFSSAPRAIGRGADPLFASSRSNADAAAALDAFTIRPYSVFGPERLVLEGVVLDLRVLPGRAGSDGDGRPENLAVIFSSSGRIRDGVPREPFALRRMERLAIILRSLTAEELRASTQGRELYDDSGPESGGDFTGTRMILTNRLRRDSVLGALERLDLLFGAEVEEEPAGDAPPRSAAAAIEQREYVRDLLGEAWARYVEAHQAPGIPEPPGAADPRGLRAWLSGDSASDEAVAIIDALRAILGELRAMGLLPRELRASIEALLAPIAPLGVDQNAFLAGIEG